MRITRPDEGQITWVFSGSAVRSGNAVCTQGLRIASGYEPSPEDAELAYAAWVSEILNLQTTGITLTRCEIRTAERVAEHGANTNGSITGDVESPQVALVVTKRTGLTGVSNRGRFYVPGLPASAVDNTGTIANLSTWQAGLDDLQFALETAFSGSFNLAVLHTDKARQPTLQTAYVARGVVGTQRGRVR